MHREKNVVAETAVFAVLDFTAFCIFMVGFLLIGSGIASLFNSSNGRIWLVVGIVALILGVIAWMKSSAMWKEVDRLKAASQT